MATKRKKAQPASPEPPAAEPKAAVNKDLDPGRGLEILRLSDIIPDGRPVDIVDEANPDGRRYTLHHPGALTLYTTAIVDRLRARWAILFRKWNANECSQQESDELDEAACQLVPSISDVPEETARAWTWRTRVQLITLHFGYIAEILPTLAPNLRAAAPPNRAARRALAKKVKDAVGEG